MIDLLCEHSSLCCFEGQLVEDFGETVNILLRCVTEDRQFIILSHYENLMQNGKWQRVSLSVDIDFNMYFQSKYQMKKYTFFLLRMVWI